MLVKSISMILIAVLISGCVYSDDSSQQIQEHRDNNYPEQTLIYKPQSTPVPELYRNLMIDNLSNDLDGFYEGGWQDLYVRGEFDCSRMTTYMWDYIRNKYKVAPKIVLAPDRKHAWLALKVVDAGDTDRYLQWDIKGTKYYYLEATIPNIVKYREKYPMGREVYASTSDFYTTKISLADDPVDANTIAGSWFNEFRLTKPDLDKLNSFTLR